MEPVCRIGRREVVPVPEIERVRHRIHRLAYSVMTGQPRVHKIHRRPGNLYQYSQQRQAQSDETSTNVQPAERQMAREPVEEVGSR